jgi:hypothetical protein
MRNEVKDLLDALYDGTMTVDDVARRFRARAWPRRQVAEPGSYLEMAAAELQDPEPYIAGSYDDVAAAYHQGRLSDADYAVLIEAVADSKRASDAGNEGMDSGDEPPGQV